MLPAETVILLAEDDPILRNLVNLMLTKEGYVVLAANDGQEVLEIAATFKEPIHLLLTDVQMPRLDGLTLAERVREQWPTIKIIVMSVQLTTTILENNTPEMLTNADIENRLFGGRYRWLAAAV